MKEAQDILKLAKAVLARNYGHTLWIDPKGKVVDLGSSNTHHDWIAKNWDKLFPDVEMTNKAVFEVPESRGWIQLRNHTKGFGTPQLAITGHKRFVKRRGGMLMDMVLEGLEDARDMGKKLYVDISYDDRGRSSYTLPDDMDELMRVL